jgi:hypothetical protein
MCLTIYISKTQKITTRNAGFCGWTLKDGKLISDTGKVYTEGNISLLEWQAAFYVRGKKYSTPARIKWMDDSATIETLDN